MASIYDSDPSTQAPRSLLEERPQLPYLIPFLAYVGLMLPSAFGHFGGIDWKDLWFTYLPAVYTIKTVLAAVLLAVFWKYYAKIRWTHLPLGVVVGLVGIAQWVLMEYASQQLHLTKPPAADTIYNPITQIPSEPLRILFYLIRIGGPTLVVPVMEELFFRDFLQRFFIGGSRFTDVAVGTFSWLSLLGMAVLFGVNHIQWPSGFVYGLMMGLLLVRTKSLGACIVAHGTTNLGLYLWVVYCGETHFHEAWNVWQFM